MSRSAARAASSPATSTSTPARGLSPARRGRGGGRPRRLRRCRRAYRQAPAPLSPPGERSRPRPGQPRAARGGAAIRAAPRPTKSRPTRRARCRTARSAAFATVVAEHATEINLLSVGEAVMRMDLADQTVLMFRNSATGELNVVYRRPTGISAGSIRRNRTRRLSAS